jgi:flavin reductase (DIM6/NTAB) family NADH-FMN oxidoreductase RutF
MRVDDFRAGMRHLAAGVSIVTATADGRPVGLTATSVSSLSDSPPSLVVCVNRKASAHDVMAHSGRFTVNILTESQAPLALRFAGAVPPAERFTGVSFADTPFGPLLEDCACHFACTLGEAHHFASHTIFVGLIEVVRFGRDRDPLVYVDGRFTGVRPREPALSA